MNEFNNPVLICNGSYKDFRDDGELICGGCGYVFSPYEAEALFKDCELQLNRTGQIDVHRMERLCIGPNRW